MEIKDVVKALVAIGHESRLAVYRLLIQKGPAGLSAGELAKLTGIPPSSLSFHLKELVHADLLVSRQEGRFVFYAVKYEAMTQLLAYLTENCCDGNPCTPITSMPCTPDAVSDS